MKNNFLVFTIVLLTVITVFNTYKLLSPAKIGYVKTGVLIQKSNSMIEANKQYEKDIERIRINVDTLKNRFVKSKERYFIDKNETNLELAKTAEEDFMKYQGQAEEDLQKRQADLTKSVLDKINSLIQEYGKKHGYKLILGTTEDGSILFGQDGDDLTEELVKDVNNVQ